MPISGTLSDIGFVSLLQFPNSSRKTGLLTVISIDGKAEFYYRKGNLIHAKYGKKKGREVLVDIVDWSEGQFTFETDVEPDEETIEDDLHHILMWALKERDEKKKNGAEEAEEQVSMDEELSSVLEEMRSGSRGVEYICMLNAQGNLLAVSDADNDFMQILSPYLDSVNCFVNEYPQDRTGKAFMETEEVSIALSVLKEGMTVVIATGPEVKLGRLSMALGKITRELGEKRM
ncbi:MAG: DUF4388 domain-containing protein [Candidatus Aegiribacteria sp.]|nr:DUF4388 domain-containing protein [Candidatus Aegiribacteria sp.]MBD3295382.1 DUF4388 domain-containing protein [Candidatus Fermentibacteria bacterium]